MKLSIRWALIIGFLGLIWGTYTITTTSTFLSSQKVLNRHARDIMQNIADLAMEQSQNHLAYAHGAAALTRRLITANVVSGEENSFQSLERYFLDQLAIYPHFAGIYIGQPNGDFYYVSRHSQRTPGGFRTKIILHRGDIRQTRLIWRDKKMDIVADEFDPQDRYDPRVRPWYQKALEKREIVWTDPYIFFTSQKPGITIAGPVYNESGGLKGVVGVDIEIDQLSIFIGNLNIGKNGRAFMINNNGDVVAFPDLEKIKTNGQSTSRPFRLAKIHELDDILSRKAFSAIGLDHDSDDRYYLRNSRFARFEHDGRWHHAMLTPFSIAQWPWIIGVHLPEDDYLGSLKENRFFNILLTLVISAAATIIALFFARSIIRPIANLEKESLAVRNNDTHTEFNIHSRYKEIQETVDSFILMKEAIRESTQKYRGIFENMQDAYYESSLDGIILELSPSIEKISPFKRADLIGSPVSQFYVSLQDRDKLIQTLLKEKKVSDYEIVLKDDNGNPNYYSLDSMLMTDEKGAPLKIIGSMRNITARKKAEQELTQYRAQLEELVKERTADLENANRKLLREIEHRLLTEAALGENEAKYRSILENIEEGYFETDLLGNFTFHNDATSRILGWSRSELLGMNLRKYTDRKTVRKVFRIFREIYRTEMSRSAIEFQITRKDRKKRYIELSISLIRNADGKPTGFRGLGRDITERIQAEKEKQRLEERLQQAQRLKAIGTLAGGIAHDFNNLLMGIQGNVSVLLTSMNAADPNLNNLKSIERCVHNGANLTRQLLGYARGGKYVVKPTDLNEIVQKSSSLFGRTKKEIKIKAEYQKDLWSVEGDSNQIEQVLVNLYLNAWQAMQPGGTIYLKTENVVLDDQFAASFEARSGRYVKISVTDRGTGIDEDTQKRIFEPFFTTKTIGKGTGLGLASAFGIVKNHDGIIHFDSAVGKGTTFYVYLPVSDKTVAAETETAGELKPGRETILIVDDEEFILETCAAMLEKMGYKVLLAGSGEKALEVFRKNQSKIDLVILDMVMPGMDGLETFEHLKQIDPQLKAILSSGYSIEDITEEIIENGRTEIIQKPFSLNQINRLIREMLNGTADGKTRS
jgi:PAS domain S-box-containing protein